jgi:hypothetical protein
MFYIDAGRISSVIFGQGRNIHLGDTEDTKATSVSEAVTLIGTISAG